MFEAQLKENLVSKHKAIFKNFLELTKQEMRKSYFDPSEEVSYILEFKVYWLMYILTFKNNAAREYLVNELDFMKYIEVQAEKYIDLLKYIIKTEGNSKNNKEAFSDVKKDSIVKTTKKFCELVYYLFFQDKDQLKIILNKKESPKFNSLLKLYEDNREAFYTTSSSSDDKFDVFVWFKKLEKANKSTD